MGYSIRLLYVLLALSTLVFAQTGTSSITGTVTDVSGEALPGVDITLLNEETGGRLTTITNDTGLYRFASLLPGTYRIEAALPSFARLSRGPITLQVSQTVPIDLMLQVGKLDETIEVTEAAPLIESQTSDIG